MIWQPIDTAPKDGTRILLYVPDYDTDAWAVPPERNPKIFIGYWHHYVETRNGVVTVDAAQWKLVGGRNSEDRGDPAYWTPLPSAPDGEHP